MPRSLRLNKFIAERVGLSRREADVAIEAGQVLVNDQPATLGIKIDKNDKVCYNGKVVPFQAHFSYLMLNKPVGYVCSRHRQGDTPTIYELLPKEYRNLKTVGRLDKDSSGLILLTNDGDFAFQMTHPKFIKTKRYTVQLNQSLTAADEKAITSGVELADGVSKLGLKMLEDRKNWQVEMSEGRNRQIRRTFAKLGYRVVTLHRFRFGPYQLNDLSLGKFTKTKNTLK